MREGTSSSRVCLGLEYFGCLQGWKRVPSRIIKGSKTDEFFVHIRRKNTHLFIHGVLFVKRNALHDTFHSFAAIFATHSRKQRSNLVERTIVFNDIILYNNDNMLDDHLIS